MPGHYGSKKPAKKMTGTAKKSTGMSKLPKAVQKKIMGPKKGNKSGAGMTAKGVAKYNRRTGGNLKTAVTGKVKPGSKDAGRRKSFCARSKGWSGPRGKAARSRWKC